ncbi:hypothetical protein DFH07DRAFT_291528 [Mycena maculata]|uniref:Uncharacterized protein n=1 Tax=Mycena maculata TaxID=230809 RepID=A0AAD7JQB1_9AGAR|nr:hypothetical protein DFH07DRAFT_291528 [Mycena maculata]
MFQVIELMGEMEREMPPFRAVIPYNPNLVTDLSTRSSAFFHIFPSFLHSSILASCQPPAFSLFLPTRHIIHLRQPPFHYQAPGSSCKGLSGKIIDFGLKKPQLCAIWHLKKPLSDKGCGDPNNFFSPPPRCPARVKFSPEKATSQTRKS